MEARIYHCRFENRISWRPGLAESESEQGGMRAAKVPVVGGSMCNGKCIIIQFQVYVDEHPFILIFNVLISFASIF